MTRTSPGVRIDLDLTLPGVRRISFQPPIKNTKAISIEKRYLNSLSKISTIKDKPVVYILLNGNQPKYVGMSYSTQNRLRTHASQKKNWDRVLIFYSLSPPLNNSITGFCEYKLVSYLQDGGIKLSQQKPSEISLSEDDSLTATSFQSEIIIILQALGIDLEVKERLTDSVVNQKELVRREKETTTSDILYFNAQKTKATAVYLGPELRVEEGAIGGPQKPSQSKGNLKTFKEMEKDDAIKPLEEDSEYWILKKPYVFSSPSAAASILKGSPQNGMICWMNDKGILLRDLLKQKKGGIK